MSAAAGMYVVLNGELVPAAEATVPADDRGFLYGDSVFTTLRCYGGVAFRLDRHCARLNASLRSPVVEINHEVNPEDLRNDIARLIELNGCPDAVARLTVTRGRGVGPLPPRDAVPTTLLTVRPYVPDARLYAEGASLIVSSVRRDPSGELGRHKLGSYFPSLLARREAAARGADEAVICDTDGDYLECASSNLFAVVGGALVTPDVTENLLPGIARDVVLDCAADVSVKVLPKKLTAEIAEGAFLGNVEEWFITNSVQEVVPVARIEAKQYTVPGPVTARLMQAYSEVVARETGTRRKPQQPGGIT